MVEQKLVNQVVKRLVPLEYQPQPLGHQRGEEQDGFPPILAIKLENDLSRFNGIVSKYKVAPKKGGYMSLKINWGQVMRRRKHKAWERFSDSYCLILNGNYPDLNSLSLEFNILFAIGLVAWERRSLSERVLWDEAQKGLFAEYWAARQIAKVDGEAKAQTVLSFFGSSWEFKEKFFNA